MADYTLSDDGKLHTRYTELVHCTPGQMHRILAERDGARRVVTEAMRFGTERHAMWEEEARMLLRTPECFGLDWPVTHIEQEFVSEILPGIVVHSRPDLVCATTHMLPDYKTVIDGVRGWKHNVDQYRHETKQRQLTFYAFQLGLHGITIREGAFLCEVWNKERDTILGYEIVRFPIPLSAIAATLSWARERALLLAAAVEEYQKEKETALRY